MQEIDVSTWEEFEDKLKDIRLNHTSRFLPLLFRGHSDSRWALDTTLERSNHKGMRYDDYYRIISSMRNEVETFTDTSWSILTYPQVMSLVQEYDTFSVELSSGRNPAYDYMAYLRHHGFPSPLLDWTRSPYVAAYFAFSNAEKSESVSIFVLSEADFHSSSSDLAKIYRFGPNIKVHRRHVLQQSEYTMCLFFHLEHKWRFAEHSTAESGEIIEGVKWNINFIKINIPASERTKVITLLDAHNLNAFSLFGTEESLMETLRRRRL